MSKPIIPMCLRSASVATCLSIILCLHVVASAADPIKKSTSGRFRVPEGFQVDLVYDVPSETQGSWVSLCIDPKGRIIASDQYGKLYRVTLPESEGGTGAPQVEQLKVNIGMAQGMLCAFDSLYININATPNSLKGTAAAPGAGVYRLTDTTGDDQYDKVEYIVPMPDKTGEHGPHALILSPDGKKIYFCSGNQVDVPKTATSGPAPRNWDEDQLLGRMPDARGHMAGRLAPGGWICSMDPDGSNVELIATGFRNEYDIAFNPQGDLFAYDADMEWDIGTPWYRPTRVNHVISGAEFGWRNGTGKLPAYFGDSFGAVVNIGPGSPTGIAFGTQAKFPEEYRKALFVSDWSYGIIYKVDLKPNGSTYAGVANAFVSAAPMAVTDLVIHPYSGAMYFAVGGRKTASSLYRVAYNGDVGRKPLQFDEPSEVQEARALRRKLESYHKPADSKAIELAIAELGNADRAIRFAARVVLEHQPVEQWQAAALSVTQPQAVINATYALSRTGAKGAQAKLLEKLTAIDFGSLEIAVQLELLRAYQLVAMRLSEPNDLQRQAIVEQINSQFPSNNAMLDRELARLLIYLKAPNIVPRTVSELQSAPSQENQIHYAFCLRDVKEGWTPESRKAYFNWFFNVASARGGASFGGFLSNIRDAALANLDAKTKQQLGKLTGKMPGRKDPMADLEPRSVVANWTVEKLEEELKKVSFEMDYKKARTLTATAQCFKCHRFNGEGGIQGPDLTSAGGRFNQHDMLEAIVDPSKAVSDQYQATQFLTEDAVVTGRVANLRQGSLSIVTNMLAPGDFTNLKVDDIIQQRPAKNSMMPNGLLDTFTPEEVALILEYLRTGGKPK